MNTNVPGVSYMFKSFEGGIERLGVNALRISSEHHQMQGKVPAQSPAAGSGKFLGLVMLFNTDTTELLAIMPDGYIQSQRVGATWAIAARHLAKERCETIAIYGSGQQAPAFLEAHCRVRPTVKRVQVYSPTLEHRRAFAERMGRKLEIEVVPVDQPRDAMRGADIVMSVNNAREPVVFSDWLETHGEIPRDELSVLYGSREQVCADRVPITEPHHDLGLWVLALKMAQDSSEQVATNGHARANDHASMRRMLELVEQLARFRLTSQNIACPSVDGDSGFREALLN